ncbi:hypothetical protein JOM56_000607 [Amanita muscaria]
MIDSLEHQDIPQRPSSRLGFHSPPSNNYLADLEDPNEDMDETANWTHLASNAEMRSRTDLASTSEMAYDFDVDITTVASADALEIHEPPLSMPPTSIDITDTSYLNAANPFSLSDDDESDGSDPDSDCSSCENEDDDFEFSLTSVPLPSSKPSSSTPTFMAPLSMSSTHSPRPPSPTEPKPITPMRLPPLRPSYSNHGYSRHALLQLKWFWAVREGKWAEDDAQMCDPKAYGGPGQSSQSSGFGPLRLSAQRNLLKPKTPPRNSTLPPMSVHPRRGDIAALRDPYSMHMDRCFVNMPSWTLAKTMYMVDVHVGYGWHSRVAAISKWKRCDDNVGISQGAEIHKKSGTEARRKKEPSTDTVDDVDLDSESESLGTSASIASSDDSDATLVEDGDLEREDYSTFEAFMSGAGPSSPSSSNENSFTTPRFKCVSPAICPTEKPSSKCPLSPSLYAQMPSRSTELLSSLNGDTKLTKPWVTNWYRRWEILLDLMRSNWDQRQLFAALSINEYPYCAEQSCSTNGDAVVAGRKGKRRLKRQPRFFVGDENSSEDSDSWEWDSSFDWKNMAQISEPGFGRGVRSLDGSVLL